MNRLLPGNEWFAPAQWVLFTLLFALLVVLLILTVRRLAIQRPGGAVECYVRAPGAGGRRGSWRIGFGRYGTEHMGWFPIFSLRPRPTAKLSRRGLVVLGRRSPDHRTDRGHLPSDVHVIQVGWISASGAEPTDVVYEIAMSESALTGFLSWLESMPPGTHWEA